MGKVWANETYFDFSAQSPIISSNNELNASLFYDLIGTSEENFRLRPQSGIKNLQVWNFEKNVWISSNDLWTNMPKLTKQTKLRFLSNSFSKTSVYFLIQDVKTSEIYETPKRHIWSRNWFTLYISKLNENIFGMVKYTSEDF